MTALSHRDTLVVEGMFCAACAASVEAALNRHPGVDNAAVNFAADAAVVDWKDDARDVDGLLERIKGLGYRPALIGDSVESERRGEDPSRYLGLRLIVALFFGMWSMLPTIVLYLGRAGSVETEFMLAVAAGVFSLPVILYSGIPFYRMGVLTLRHGAPGIDALITLGVVGAVVLSAISLATGSGDVYFEVAIALITLQLIARMLDLKVRRRARDAVLGLLTLSPTRVSRILDDGEVEEQRLSDIEAGMRLRVFPGTRLAVDGTVASGRGAIDRSLFSGESESVAVATGDAVHAGERVLDAQLDIEVTAGEGRRCIDALGRQVRQFLTEKPPWQQLADTLARYFLWLALIASAIGATVALVVGEPLDGAAARALAVFVIACPCALSLAAPLAGLMASAKASRRGFILRDLNALTSAAQPDILCFDKTGTLTVGRPEVRAIYPTRGNTEGDVLRVAATAETGSEHPLAAAILRAAKELGINVPSAGNARSIAGSGVEYGEGKACIRVGRLEWLREFGIGIPDLPESDATRIGVAKGSAFIGAIDLHDAPRDGVADMCRALDSDKLCILSGDRDGPVTALADSLGIRAFANQSPEDKADWIREQQKSGKRVAFVGDGLNDGPALAAADLGIAVGDATDAARSASAITLVDADVTALPEVLRLTRRTRGIIRQNLSWAVVYNGIAIPAAIAGFVHPAVAAVAMALSSLSIVLNALRA